MIPPSEKYKIRHWSSTLTNWIYRWFFELIILTNRTVSMAWRGLFVPVRRGPAVARPGARPVPGGSPRCAACTVPPPRGCCPRTGNSVPRGRAAPTGSTPSEEKWGTLQWSSPRLGSRCLESNVALGRVLSTDMFTWLGGRPHNLLILFLKFSYKTRGNWSIRSISKSELVKSIIARKYGFLSYLIFFWIDGKMTLISLLAQLFLGNVNCRVKFTRIRWKVKWAACECLRWWLFSYQFEPRSLLRWECCLVKSIVLITRKFSCVKVRGIPLTV